MSTSAKSKRSTNWMLRLRLLISGESTKETRLINKKSWSLLNWMHPRIKTRKCRTRGQRLYLTKMEANLEIAQWKIDKHQTLVKQKQMSKLSQLNKMINRIAPKKLVMQQWKTIRSLLNPHRTTNHLYRKGYITMAEENLKLISS